MKTVCTAPHELEGNLVFTGDGLAPYWMVGQLLHTHYGGHGDIETEIVGEAVQIQLTYQQGGIAPRPEDPLNADRLYEYRIGILGNGQRKANFLIQPRFEGMQHHESGDAISTPFDRDGPDEGVNVRIAGSNLEPDEFTKWLYHALQALGEAAGVRVNGGYFASQPHDWSNITTYERYIRITRNMGQKVIGRDGVFRRLWELCAHEKGSQIEYKIDNEDIVGYNHRLVLPKADAKRLAPGHRYGKQLKHYHPKHVRKKDDTDPLYHPKIGVLLKKSLSGHSFAWADRRELRAEIDETLINCLRWSGVPIGPDSTTYVGDDHFHPRASERTVALYDDPTPQIEASQEALLVTTLRDLTPAGVEVVESLVTDGGEQHPAELAENTGRGVSTVYRVLQHLDGLIENDSATVRFGSRKLEQELRGLIESTEYHIESAADRAASILNMDVKGTAAESWQRWLNEYGVSVVRDDLEGTTVRIDTVLSRIKSSRVPRLEDVLSAGFDAWTAIGRDPAAFREVTVKWTPNGREFREAKVGATLR